MSTDLVALLRAHEDLHAVHDATDHCLEAADEIERLRKLLAECAEPISDQLAEARRNVVLYKGYSMRERRYQLEIERLERLLKETGCG
jgi:hypothetical protein